MTRNDLMRVKQDTADNMVWNVLTVCGVFYTGTIHLMAQDADVIEMQSKHQNRPAVWISIDHIVAMY